MHNSLMRRISYCSMVLALASIFTWGCFTTAIGQQAAPGTKAKPGPDEGSSTQRNEFKPKSVKTLIREAGVLHNDLVHTWGFVDTREPAPPGQVKVYRLKGDEGGIIEIHHTGEAPRLYTQLRIKGIFQLSQSGTFYINETERRIIDGGPPPPPPPPPPPWWERIEFIIGAAALVVVIAIFAAFMIFGRRQEEIITGGGGTVKPPSQPVHSDKKSYTIINDRIALDNIDLKRDTVVNVPWKLIIEQGGPKGQALFLLASEVVLGRIGDTPRGIGFIGLEGESVSSDHFRVNWDVSTKTLTLTNLNPTNWTLYNQTELGKHEARVISDGDVITVPKMHASKNEPDYMFRFVPMKDGSFD